MRRSWAASTSTARCCRAGAARRRSIAPSWRATPRPASPPCAWTKGSTPARCCWPSARRSPPPTPPRSVHDRLAELGARLIVSTLDGLVRQDARAGAAVRGGRHLRPQARQGGRRARLAAARRRARAQGARLPSLARHMVRRASGERIKVLAAGLALAGGAPGTLSVGTRRLSGRGLRHRRAQAPEAAARRQVGAVGRRLPARLCLAGRHGAGAARRRSAADLIP